MTVKIRVAEQNRFKVFPDEKYKIFIKEGNSQKITFQNDKVIGITLFNNEEDIECKKI